MRCGSALLLSVLLPATAHAVGQGETVVAGGLGMATLVDGETRTGLSGGARLLRGLSDAWSLQLGLELAWLPATAGTPATRLVAPRVGLGVAADVLNLVPFAELGLVVADLRGGGDTSRQRLGCALALGGDYLFTRHLTVSLLGRLDYLPLRLAGGHDASPLLLGLALYLGYVF